MSLLVLRFRDAFIEHLLIHVHTVMKQNGKVIQKNLAPQEDVEMLYRIGPPFFYMFGKKRKAKKDIPAFAAVAESFLVEAEDWYRRCVNSASVPAEMDGEKLLVIRALATSYIATAFLIKWGDGRLSVWQELVGKKMASIA